MDVKNNLKDVGPSSSLHRTDSFRKVLPSKPSATVDSRLSMSMKMIDRPISSEGNNRGNKMFLPYLLEYAIMAEYLMLQKQELTGIYVIPSDVDPLVWFGVIFIRQGLYEGGIFRFQLHFPEDFPNGPCPKVVFESDVFHPSVNIETGELNVSDEFKDWKRTVNHVWQVLQYISRIFYRIDNKSAANNVAAELFSKDYEKFKKLVTLCVEESQSKIHQKPENEDPNYLHFEPYSESLHESVREQIRQLSEGQVGSDLNQTFEAVKQDENEEEEEEEEDDSNDNESSTSDEESKEVPNWDSFLDYRNESESISMVDNSFVDFSIQIFKLFAYLVTFFIVLAGAVFSKSTLLLMTSQLTPNKTVTVKTGSVLLAVQIPAVEKYLWVWALLICFSIPELGVLIWSARKAIFKGYVSKDNFGSGSKTRQLTFKFSVVVLVMETLHVVGLAIFIFQILPHLDVAKGVMLTNCVCLIPGLLTVTSNLKTYEFRKVQVYVEIVAVLFQITGLLVWPIVLGANFPMDKTLWTLPLSLLLISCGWWMNYVSDESPFGFIKFLAEIKDTLKETEIHMYRLYLGISIWKILLFFGTSVLVLALQGMDMLDFFDKTYRAFGERQIEAEEVDRIEGTYTGLKFSIPSIGPNVWWIIGAQVLSSYICYIFGKFACRVKIQPFSFAFPCALAVPLTIVFLVLVTGLRNQDLTVFESFLPNYLFFNSPQIYIIEEFFIQEFGWVWIFWLVSQISITFHVWSPRCERLSRTEKLFATPIYSGLLVDQSITLNRRRDMVETRENYQSPHIIACATMWHETKPEMIMMLKSLLRMDNDQCLKRGGKENLNDPDAEADFYTFESHIFFDDAFELEDDDTNKTVINPFVKDLLKSINKAKDGIYGTDEVQIKPPLKYSTPYGGRLEYTLPGESKLYVHLKDKDKIRHKKRWSQVMYMYYLLGYQLMELPIPYEKKQEKAENTFILALDGDIDFKPDAVILLIDLMKKNKGLGAACGRIHPVGSGFMVWYQLFEYAIGHWLQKATEHTIGCVLCSPGCFSLFRAKALMSPNVMKRYTTKAEEPLHYVQYDQGEDRWLCTLLLQRGYRVEYSAASDAYTHCPESFNEFYTQRRRWIPSTVANIIDLLKDFKKTVRVNNDISFPYIAYQMLLLVGSILGPGTILLMLVGAFNAAFKIDNWVALYYNLIPISAFILCCLFTSQKFQISAALIISLIYGLIMMAVLIGIVMEIKDDGLLSPSSIFLFLTAGEIIISGILHPQEILCLLCGVIYYVTIPSMYLLLIIYSVCNLNVVSWGTREVKKKKTKAELENEKKEAELAEKKAQKTRLFGILGAFSGKKEKEESGALEFSLSNIFKCMCCTSEKPNQTTEQFVKIGETLNVLKQKLDNIERGQTITNIEDVELRRKTYRKSILPENIEKPNDDNVLVKGSEKLDEEELRDELFNPYWIEDKHLKHSKFEVLTTSEIAFWRDLISKYLSPLAEDKEKQEKVKTSLKELRDKMVVTFFMLNALFVVVVFLLQVNKDQIHIKWPLEAKANITFNPVTYEITIFKNYLHLEPVGLTFIAFFASIMVIQFIAMLLHRFETLCHLLSTTRLTILKTKKDLTFREKLEVAKKRFTQRTEKRKRTRSSDAHKQDQPDWGLGDSQTEKRKSKLINLDQEYTEILNQMKEDEERKEAEKIERRRSSLLPWKRMSYQNHRASKVNSFVNLGMQKIDEEG